ncbi:hypothetical protein [Pseudomonas shahriarae]|uniref:hypothetical protein n=1 Tax=Pseudomonas shahriarae TaxID=2745512 RepID=UPI0023601314|nr:hypothetical protein [Pseudomonas shahriarae]MDD0981104.1 hypothetical protein [Pseudomonas shahriarae]
MKVRFAIVDPDILTQVLAAVDLLKHAVNNGHVDDMDTATAQLLALTAECQSIDLSEEDWRAFVNGVWKGHPRIESSYLLPGAVCVSLFPTIAADAQVLELPMDDETGDTNV